MGWNIDKLKQDPEVLEKAKEEYLSRAIYRPIIDCNSQQEDPMDSQKRCWTALKYTSPRTLSTTPAVKGENRKVAITLEQKEELFLESQFPKIQTNDILKSIIPQDGGINLITDQIIKDALFSQSIKKISE